MSDYQLAVLFRSDLSEEARTKILDSIKDKVVKEEGAIKTEELWGHRGLAYPIKGQDKGFYVYFNLELERGKVSELDKTIKLNEDILRYLLIKS